MRSHGRKRDKRIKQAVIDRDGTICCYCDRKLLLEEITMEHIVPHSHRGMFNLTNLTVACRDCNNRRKSRNFFKYARTFGWSNKKIWKYKKLYLNNLKIKVLNIAKKECLVNDLAVPNHLINAACEILKIKSINIQSYKKYFLMDFNSIIDRATIISNFETLIKLIESDSK